ncbi:ABC transporter, permease protein 2 (cluster 5, nickel/peptides/opines) [hydrothermal vent metagenome]|uniref:ABC transporter, permease protein 2 (Cluster 5, nickel/peptides/opines) n=1 Tax=hydrothermal vent metagenome TaxID=652676 RepID=A0A3B1BAC7_9ZZZZ
MPELVILWTDALIFLLIGLMLIFGHLAASREYLRAPWRRVAHSRIGMGALVVLSAYMLIGVLDSVHYHPTLPAGERAGEAAHSNEVLSLLDYLLTPLRERQEKTYSSPLATSLYTKENIEQPDGSMVRDYPPLKYGGAHLNDPEQDWAGDIVKTVMIGMLEAALAWVLIAAGLIAWLGRRAGCSFSEQRSRIFQRVTEVPWSTILTVFGVLLLVAFITGNLSLKYHLLGTDKVGEDVFYQALKSIRTGLVIGTLTTLIMLPAAIMMGIMAGYFRGWVDDVIQYIYTTLSSIPGVLLIAAAILMLHVYMNKHADEFTSLVERADLRLLFLCIILGVTSWTGLCRLLRGEVLKLRELDYVQAAQAFGVGHITIITRHLLPNVLHIVMIAVVLEFSGLVLAEAVLSYVNIGVDPTMNSWGNMINSARLEMAREPIVWWSLVAALIFMFTLVLAANLFSDVVRDAFDPRLRGGK